MFGLETTWCLYIACASPIRLIGNSVLALYIRALRLPQRRVLVDESGVEGPASDEALDAVLTSPLNSLCRDVGDLRWNGLASVHSTFEHMARGIFLSLTFSSSYVLRVATWRDFDSVSAFFFSISHLFTSTPRFFFFYNSDVMRTYISPA